jgi:hypothetical protein
MFKTIRTEIAKNQWQSFCEDYTRQHEGWIVKIDVYDPSMSKLGGNKLPIRLQSLAVDLMFRGIVFQDGGGRPELLVNLGRGKELFTHRLMRPTHIVALESDNGFHEGLLLHDRNGGLVQIRFREPARPELLNGWLALETDSRGVTHPTTATVPERTAAARSGITT